MPSSPRTKFQTLAIIALALALFGCGPGPGQTTTCEPPAPPSWVTVRTSDAGAETAPADKGPSGAMKALQYWAASRAYPHPEATARAYGAAIGQARDLAAREAGAIDDGVPPWQPIGPTNVGGRTLTLALHPSDPDVMFAGSASGGLWRSDTGGVGADAWDYVDTGLPVLGVSSIAIDPATPDVMYIGTGEAYDYDRTIGGEVIRATRGSYGVGILKTTDGGGSWAPTLDWTYQQSRGVWMLQIHPTTTNVVYAATTEGIYKTSDAGFSWARVHDVVMAMDVRIHPTNPDIVFAGHGNFSSTGHGLYRSTDAGQNWTQLTSGLPATFSGKPQLAISQADPETWFASLSDSDAGIGLYRSTDGGDTWSRVNNTDYPQYQGWYAHYVVASPFDVDTLFTGGIELSLSTDGGSSLDQRSDWRSVYFGTSPPEGPLGDPDYAHADHHFALWHPTDPNTVFFTSDGGVFKTTDLGATFESLIGGYQTTQFYNGFSNSATDPDFALGGLQDNFTVIYEGDGAWSRAIGGDGCWTAQHPTDSAKLYGSAQGLYVVRSTNGGGVWEDIRPPNQADDATAFVAPFVMCPAQPDVLYAGRSRIYRTDDGGDNWSATNGGDQLSPGNPALSMAVSVQSPDVAYVGTAPIVSRARLFTTRDGGSSWLDVTGILPDRYPSDIAVDPNDASRVYVTFLGFGTSHVFKSDDGGDSWQDIGAGLPDIPHSAVEVDPARPDVLYVGTDLGIYVSTDGGGAWEPFTNGMPLAMVNDLKVFSPDRKLRAATHGSGAWERDLYGLSILRSDDVTTLAAVADANLPWTDPDPVLSGPFPPLFYYQVEGIDRFLMYREADTVTITR